MATLDSSKLPIVTRALHVPPLEEIRDILREALPANFAEVTIDVVDCPDLTQQPFSLAEPGFGGGTKLLEIGGIPYLFPHVHRDKVYDIKSILQNVDHSGKAFIIGAGVGPWPLVKSNCELMMNMSISPTESSTKNATHICMVDKGDGKCVDKTLSASETRFSLSANLFLSEGKPGKVIKVHVKKRSGSNDFIGSIRAALAARYTEQVVCLGGAFLLKEGKAKLHIMSDFTEAPLISYDDLKKWLNFFEMSAPLVALGTLVTASTDLDLLVEHFHTFSDHGEGGHFHFDTTPDTAEYVGYFNVIETVYRVDQPPVPFNFEGEFNLF
ncbi:ester hydrolase C11orf54 homolog [Neodiprion lecontei]|uniref:Ester hydrolase C11orf54 homolog n=1 Tax=Neodiprion lecontei TaxID=441921 RepID=A0A6J0BXH5_NEOLC|nr:ester hydrolase C11orf54 homolog [Neodiprion lecontei]XP_015519106.2 ester hydrolase C11orf54 homolog [Neodiprion lecontei]